MAIFLIALAATSVAVVNCQSCSPGEETINDVCKECVIGFYSRDGMNCKKCSECHDTQYEFRKCSLTEDRYCMCPEGTYFDQKNLVCSQCRNCEKGFSQEVDCTHNFDRTCKKCPEGQTSNGTNTKLCWVESKAHDVVSKKEAKKEWAYLLGGIGAIFILVCLVLALFRWKKRRRFLRICGKKVNDELENLAPRPFTDNNQGISDVPPFSNSAVASSSKTSSAVPLLIRDVPACVYFELGKKLNPNVRNNWKTLAGELGYNYEAIGNFNLSPKSATEDLLHNWSTFDDSTVQKLYLILNSMKRPDAAEILKPHI